MKNPLTTPAALRLTTILLLGALSAEGAGVTSAAELPGATPAAIEKASLDHLEGQAVDLAPWAFAWRADVAVQEKPEAYFIPRRLERIPEA